MEIDSAKASKYISEARRLYTEGRKTEAVRLLVMAAECVRNLVVKSTGKEKAKYVAQCKTIMEMASGMAEGIKADKQKARISAQTKDSSEANSNENAPDVKPPVTPADDGKANSANKKPEGGKTKKVGFNDSLSPKKLNDYIGQPQAVNAVRDLITASILKHSAMPHIILYGSHGLGKTTFAKIIANEVNAGFIEVNVTGINPKEMIAILKKLQPRDILFIDEIHTLPLAVAESILYSAMQDGKVTYTEGKGRSAHTETLVLPPFTLIGATTEIGKLAKPFTQRAIQVRLVEYSDEVLGGIIKKSFYKLGMNIADEEALYIAKRCRNNPRIANNTVKRISDKALVKYVAENNLPVTGELTDAEKVRALGITIQRSVIDGFFEENGIDQYGLEKGDRELLRLIIKRYNGGPVGIDTLSKALNESNNVVSEKYEAYLIKKGFLRIDRDGRVVMPAGYKALGLPVPEGLEGPENAGTPDSANGNAVKDETPKIEPRKVIACLVPDARKCQKVEDLIVYPENVKIYKEGLDELFPPVEKPVVEDTPKHRSYLEIEFSKHKRVIECDSYLESKFAICMASVGYLQDINSQTLELAYISQALADRRYFPDFVIKDYKGRIAVIEMKNYDMMSYHLNIDKYEKLKEYCIEHGYGYAEIMKAYKSESYVSLEQLKNPPEPIDPSLAECVYKKLEDPNVEFTEEDYKAYLEEHPDVPKTAIYTLLLNDRGLKNQDRDGCNLKIVKN